jgi:hypothetical protein
MPAGCALRYAPDANGRSNACIEGDYRIGASAITRELESSFMT